MIQDLAFQYPADLEKAYKHRLANRIFKGIQQTGINDEKCECCGRRIGKQLVQTKCMYSPLDDLIFLGPGVPILFSFIQNGIILLSSIIAVFSIYALISNILGDSCKNIANCTLIFFNKITISNNIFNDDSLLIQAILILSFVTFYNILNQFFIYRVRKINFICDELIISPSDYSIIIKNLPQKVTAKQIEIMIAEQRDFITAEEKKETFNLSINKIILSYNIQQYQIELNKQEEQFAQSRKKGNQDHFILKPLTIPTQTGFFALVIFDKQSSKNILIKQISLFKRIKNIFTNYCQSNIGDYVIQQNHLAIQKAPQPCDIQWFYAHKSNSLVARNRFLTHFGGILILGIGFAIQFLLQKAQIKFKDTELQRIIGIMDSLLLNVTNALIVSFLIHVTRIEGNYTRTQQNQSLLIKICIYEFFNAGIFNSLASILADKIQNFNVHGTFSEQIIVFMVVNSLSSNIVNLIMVRAQPIQTFKRYLLKKGCLKYTQKQANNLYTNPKIHFPVKYSYVIKLIWLSCFYAPFCPIVVPIAVLGLLFNYFIEAYLFRTSYNVPKMLSISLAKTAIILMDFTPIIISLGQMSIIFYIQYNIQGKIYIKEVIPIVVAVFFSIAMYFVPAISINEYFFKFQSKERNEISYNDARNFFQITYEQTFPLNKANKINSKIEDNMVRKIIVNSHLTKMVTQGLEMQNIQSPSIFKNLINFSISNSVQ